MSGRGKGSKGTKTGTRATNAGLIFPPARTKRHLKAGHYSRRIGWGAAVYLAAVLEYCTAEILELAGNAARDRKKNRITPRDIFLAIQGDDEFHKLCHNVAIPQGGVAGGIHAALLPAKSKGAAAAE